MTPGRIPPLRPVSPVATAPSGPEPDPEALLLALLLRSPGSVLPAGPWCSGLPPPVAELPGALPLPPAGPSVILDLSPRAGLPPNGAATANAAAEALLKTTYEYLAQGGGGSMGGSLAGTLLRASGTPAAAPGVAGLPGGGADALRIAAAVAAMGQALRRRRRLRRFQAARLRTRLNDGRQLRRVRLRARR